MADKENISFVECSDYEQSAGVIREAFQTVADEFHITKENAPSNGAFIQADALKALGGKGLKLSVLPGKRHHGIGGRVLGFAEEYIKSRSGAKISIAIVNENTVLKRWYESYGFKEVRLKVFEHLPFTVCFMELPLV